MAVAHFIRCASSWWLYAGLVALALVPAWPGVSAETPPRRPTLPSERAATRARIPRAVNPATAADLAAAMGVPAANLVSATLAGSDPSGAGIGTRSLGRFFPRQGGTFVVLSTGLAADAELPNDFGGSTVLGGLDNSQGNDMVQLRLVLQPPPGATCLAFDFAFYSEEFPEFVGSDFNDVFLAELGGSNFVITQNNTVTAPLNFAFDSQGQLVSVNTAFGVTPGTESTYDGGTPLLRAVAALDPLTFPVELVLTITDLSDSILDSAVLVDNFEFLFGGNCSSGGLVEISGVQIVGLVSVGVLGTLPNGASGNPVISGDASFVAFESNAPNLAEAETLCGDESGAGRSHLYRRNLKSQDVRCISRTNPPGDGDSTAPSISRDGNVIAYRSTATNLASGCADGRGHILVKDVAADTHTCLTAGADASSDNPAVSADGQTVVFDTQASNLAAQCGGGSVIRFDRLTGSRTCLSPNGAPSARPAVSEDGRTVVFESSSAAFGCANSFTNVVQSVFGSRSCLTTGANGSSGQPDVSDDGRTVAFVSVATNLNLASLELNCTNGIQQVYIRSGNVTRCFSRGVDGLPGDGPSSDPALSGNGGAIAFTTTATNVIPPTLVGPVPASGTPGVVAQNQALAQVMRRSTAAFNSTLELMSGSGGGTGNRPSRRPSLDDAGTAVAFESQADNLVSGDTNGQSDVLVTNEAPPPPIGRATIFTPATGSVFPLATPTTITFSWTPVAGATQYGFEFSARDRQFTNANGIGPDSINGFGGGGGGMLVAGTTFPATLDVSSIPLGTYNVRVIAFGLPGSTFSDSVGVTLGPVPVSGPFSPEVTVTPSGVPFFPGSPVAFAWTAVPGAPQYRLDFTGPLSGSIPVTATSLGVDIPFDAPLGTYEVTVTALDGAGRPLGPPSDPVTVIVGLGF